MLSFHSTETKLQEMMGTWKETLVVLIPKFSNASAPEHYRPISLLMRDRRHACPPPWSPTRGSTWSQHRATFIRVAARTPQPALRHEITTMRHVVEVGARSPDLLDK
ncbi:hypothetical protein KSP39_PZI001089 [Platanthera zijinensis]|uniref:Uncharacterized protein n=1 Tax=Platanthera zijinensis TaxID=2320716 RepID=A0AAP0C1V2_9ASPA